MTGRLLAVLAVGACLIAPGAFAQQSPTPSHIYDGGSGQGGYLGSDPGAESTPAAPQQLGAMPNALRGAPQPARPTIDASSPPTAYCDSASMEPDRCRSRAADDHKMCSDRTDSASYMACRRTLDLFGWRL
jgi:hypothetical protein